MRTLAGCTAFSAFFLTGCAGLSSIHDPQTLVLPKDQVPAFLKSVRCELVTYYEANRQRQAAYTARFLQNPQAAVREASYFDLDENAYGAVFVDLKVTDSAGITAASLANRINNYTNHSETLTIGPTLSADGIYDLNWSFLVHQNARLNTATSSENTFKCFASAAGDKEALAYDNSSDNAQFRRITVNGGVPLAGWLLENGTQVASTKFSTQVKQDETESMEAGQLVYSFTAQGTAGFDLRYAVTTTTWNPLMPQAGASTKQTSNLQIFINGENAATVLAAKSGGAAIVPPPKRPIPVYIQNPPPGVTILQKAPEKFTAPSDVTKLRKKKLEQGVAPKPRKGYLLFAPNILPTTPGQAVPAQ